MGEPSWPWNEGTKENSTFVTLGTMQALCFSVAPVTVSAEQVEKGRVIHC